MTGITRVSKESTFSDLNNPEVVITTSDKYAASFGFTKEEVFASLEEFGFSEMKEKVKYWYDGFIFGKQRDIYNSWTILNFLDKRNFMPSGEELERFYHGFVFGLIVDLQDRYVITSNRENGFGRYDVMLESKNPQKDDAVILEFKVQDPEDEKMLKDTVQEAHRQIEEKQYATQLAARGIPRNRIRSYGFAFRGKTVLIG